MSIANCWSVRLLTVLLVGPQVTARSHAMDLHAMDLHAIDLHAMDLHTIDLHALDSQATDSQGVESRVMVPQGIAPQSIAPQSIAPQSIAPQSIAPQSIAPQSIAPQSIAPPGILSQASDIWTSGTLSTDSLTIKLAVKVALASHPTLDWYDAEARRFRGLRVQQSPFQPLSVSYEREGIDDGSFQEQRISFGQVIANPIAAVYARNKFDQLRSAAVYSKGAQSRQVVADVRKSFVRLMYASEVRDLQSGGVSVAESVLDAAERRVAAGEAARLEVLRARIDLVDARVLLTEAERAVLSSRSSVYLAAGMGDDDILPPIVIPGLLRAVPVQVDSLLVRASVDSAPEMLSAGEIVASARSGLRATRSGLFPDVVGEVFPQDFGDGYSAYGFQVGLRFRLPVSATYRGRNQESAAILEQAQSVERESRLATIARIDSAWVSFRASQDALLLLNDEAVQDAEELLDLTRRAYNLGEVSLLEVLDVRSSVLNVRLRRLKALRTYYLRAIELERVTGIDILHQIGW